ncbi:MAG: DNA cytosine methyltransferase [Prevotellaceae bacterium]|jgi:DNA (cytosine-5)-methyltransferase 1|nr:DNA cytosine methyltransferase [Prevotellaceae bacterium]
MDNIRLLYIDLFCGAGGTSTGVENARINGEKCAKVIACVNHDANAIASHAANHPDALHFTEDIRTLELSPLVAHIEKMKAIYPDAFVVLWASLECTNFSKAKGGKPRDADSRTLAIHLYRYIETINPDYIQVENVEEIMSWGDLDENGKPVSKDKGKSYTRWVEHVKKYGFSYTYRILNAANYGAYTSRKRFFCQFAKHGLPVAWPEPTHAKSPQQGLFGKIKKWKPVKDVLDFSDEGESIFTRKKPLSDKTLERIYAGLIKFVAGGKDNFLSAYYGNGKTNFKDRYKQTALSTDKPCGVVTTENRFAKVQAQFLSKYYNGHPESKNISIEEPAHTVTPVDHHALTSIRFIGSYCGGKGNQSSSVSSVENPSRTVTAFDRLSLVSPKFIVNEYSSGGQHSSIDEVCPAVLTNPKQKVVSCTPCIMNTNFSNVGSAVTEPSQTITANRKWYYIMNPQYFSAGGSVENPCFTIIARMDKKPPYLISTETGHIAIEVYDTDSEPMRKIKEFMALYGIVDIKMRMLKILELKRIMGFPNDYVLIGTQAKQKKYIGNAVEVTMARVLCEALVEKLLNKIMINK